MHSATQFDWRNAPPDTEIEAERERREEAKRAKRRAFAANFAAIDFSKEIPAPPRAAREAPKRSDLPCPRVISDSMDALQSMATGKFYESKAALRAEYKATGHIEVGNDKRGPWKMPRTSREQVRETVRKARARVERGERNIHRGK